jgi:hypothetical protein
MIIEFELFITFADIAVHGSWAVNLDIAKVQWFALFTAGYTILTVP